MRLIDDYLSLAFAALHQLCVTAALVLVGRHGEKACDANAVVPGRSLLPVMSV